MFAAVVERGNNMIGKCFPAQCGMGMRLAGAHGQHGVEQQHALLGPVLQIAVVGRTEAGNILRQLFVDIQQRGGNGNALAHGKCQSVCLLRAVVWVLPENHRTYLAELGGTESVEYVGGRRIDGLSGQAFLSYAVDDMLKIGLLLFRTDGLVPGLHTGAPCCDEENGEAGGFGFRQFKGYLKKREAVSGSLFGLHQPTVGRNGTVVAQAQKAGNYAEYIPSQNQRQDEEADQQNEGGIADNAADGCRPEGFQQELDVVVINRAAHFVAFGIGHDCAGDTGYGKSEDAEREQAVDDIDIGNIALFRRLGWLEGG